MLHTDYYRTIPIETERHHTPTRAWVLSLSPGLGRSSCLSCLFSLLYYLANFGERRIMGYRITAIFLSIFMYSAVRWKPKARKVLFSGKSTTASPSTAQPNHRTGATTNNNSEELDFDVKEVLPSTFKDKKNSWLLASEPCYSLYS